MAAFFEDQIRESYNAERIELSAKKKKPSGDTGDQWGRQWGAWSNVTGGSSDR